MGSTLLALAFAATCLLAGGFYESIYSLLAGLVWLALAAAPPRRVPGVFWPLAALTAMTALSGLWGAAGAALRVAPLAALYAGVALAAANVERELLLRLAWAVCVGVAAVGLAASALGLAPDVPGPGSARLAWPLGYANGLGLVCGSGLLLSFRLPRRLGLAGGTLCGIALALTFSRAALLATAVGLVVLAARRGRIPRPAAAAGAAVLAVAALALAQPLAARFAAPAPDTRDARRLLDVSGHGRAELWRSAWEQGLDAPVLGNGAGTWARGFVADRGAAAAPANAHSLPLETFAELGLVGLALLAALGVAAARTPARDGVAAALAAAWAVQACVDWTWQLPAATLPALFAIAGCPNGRSCSEQRSPRRTLALGLAALAVGAACAAHGVGAALLESGRPGPAARLLPFDARPALARGDVARACELDPGEVALRRRADPPAEGCPPG